jgi:hypothetical protein
MSNRVVIYLDILCANLTSMPRANSTEDAINMNGGYPDDQNPRKLGQSNRES